MAQHCHSFFRIQQIPAQHRYIAAVNPHDVQYCRHEIKSAPCYMLCPCILSLRNADNQRYPLLLHPIVIIHLLQSEEVRQVFLFVPGYSEMVSIYGQYRTVQYTSCLQLVYEPSKGFVSIMNDLKIAAEESTLVLAGIKAAQVFFVIVVRKMTGQSY